jgi:WD40 repeat protein
VRVWNTTTGALVAVLNGHTGKVNYAEFSPNGRLVATAGSDNTARIWEATSGALVTTLEGHLGEVTHAAFSSDGARVITVSLDGTATLWNSTGGSPVARLVSETGPLLRAVFSSDGTHAVTMSSKQLGIWDLKSARLVATTHLKSGEFTYAGYSANGTRVISATSDGNVSSWNAKDGKALESHQLLKGRVVAVDATDDAPHAAMLSGETVLIWNFATGTNVSILRQHSGKVTDAQFSKDGRRVVSACADGTVKLWDLDAKQPITDLMGHGDRVQDAVFSPDGSHIATASADGTGRVWDRGTGKTVATCGGYVSPIARVEYSPDGSRVYTTSNDVMARTWDARSGQLLATLPKSLDCDRDSRDCPRVQALLGAALAQNPERHNTLFGRISKAAVSASGELVLTMLSDRSVELWLADSGMVVARLNGERKEITDLSFSPNGSRFAIAFGDGTVEIWDARSGIIVTELPNQSSRAPGEFDAEGCNEASFTEDRYSRMRVDFSSSGTRVVLHWENHDGAVVSNASDGSRVSRLRALPVKGCSFFTLPYFSDPSFPVDETRVVATWGASAYMWLTGSGKRIAAIPRVVHANVSPDGKAIVTTDVFRSARLWPATYLEGLRWACIYVKSSHWPLPERYRDLPAICDKLSRERH